MSGVAHFEVMFPAYGSKAPNTKPNGTVQGTVVLKLDSPLAATFIELQYHGIEEVRTIPLETPASEASEAEGGGVTKVSMGGAKGDTLKELSKKGGEWMSKVFFKEEVVLWGSKRRAQVTILDSQDAQTFHFMVKMPEVNMPVSRNTDNYRIRYLVRAVIFSEARSDQGRKFMKEIYKTPEKEIKVFPTIMEGCEISKGSAPFRTTLQLRERSKKDEDGSGSGKVAMEAIVFQPYPSYIPGEEIDVLLLLAGNKSLKPGNCAVVEEIRCRKSSAPTIDESEIPTLWKMRRDITPREPIDFVKLTKSSVQTELGSMGRFMFTNLGSVSDAKSIARSGSKAGMTSTMSSRMSTAGMNSSTKGMTATMSKMQLSTASRLQEMKRANRGQGGSDRVQMVPVALGGLLANDSYRYARIKLQLPTADELSPVPSVFMDFEYNLEVTISTVGFVGGLSKKLIGHIPLKLISSRSINGIDMQGNVVDLGHAETTLTGTGDASSKLAQNSTDNPNYDPNVHSSQFERSFPTLQSFLQYGESIPSPKIDLVKIK
ncbi:hypothetical protein AX774_g508 [Zancudomyces culisetae]|uniref:Arrestin-like N-terminal domain-containing protein n=1 Tax=Zancudomyces culisetae TaxID=1213189 RepID=A0A1R1PYD9_ZANCU|nr:hypothetical protein AX774_g508 [Zancudomyces culisetae]|eukprot:OMH85927.1 hypothetical protein AX774_g508 [Zancudomyces culisetae]